MEKSIKNRRELSVAFIDLEKAHNRVNRRVKLWKALTQVQVKEGPVTEDFKRGSPKCVCIIDCFEVFCEC